MADEQDPDRARLDRIERHIQKLTEASAALQKELTLARKLAAERARANRPLITQPAPRKRR